MVFHSCFHLSNVFKIKCRGPLTLKNSPSQQNAADTCLWYPKEDGTVALAMVLHFFFLFFASSSSLIKGPFNQSPCSLKVSFAQSPIFR